MRSGFKTSLANMAKPHLFLKIQKKISGAWWWVPVIPATQGAEAEESLEPGRWRVAAQIMLLHSSLGNRARLCLKKQRKKKTNKKRIIVP